MVSIHNKKPLAKDHITVDSQDMSESVRKSIEIVNAAKERRMKRDIDRLAFRLTCRYFYRKGYPAYEIAKHFNIDVKFIKNICRGKTVKSKRKPDYSKKREYDKKRREIILAYNRLAKERRRKKVFVIGGTTVFLPNK